ncbi:hypothetical protein C4D60_Mb05t10360 [Musa balbisiana]|uniref:Uncharacterized protein n=1 Tax=Musa balbisiana TaxID=52838 RepID=A0A4S8JV30_MUSBA|nr:hypothetical protein C4D60_Mb05t10360 [Musa balbisiana]
MELPPPLPRPDGTNKHIPAVGSSHSRPPPPSVPPPSLSRPRVRDVTGPDPPAALQSVASSSLKHGRFRDCEPESDSPGSSESAATGAVAAASSCIGEDGTGRSEADASTASAAAWRRRRRVEFQWFLTALSVRPGRRRAMVAHLFPYRAWAATMASSSAGLKGRRCTVGLSWLHHRSRHDFPDRPGMLALITVQLRGPCCSTSRIRTASSSGFHEPLTGCSPTPPPFTTAISSTTTTTTTYITIFITRVDGLRWGFVWFAVSGGF